MENEILGSIFSGFSNSIFTPSRLLKRIQYKRQYNDTGTRRASKKYGNAQAFRVKGKTISREYQLNKRFEKSYFVSLLQKINPFINHKFSTMKLFILYQTDNWKSRASRVCFGVFDTRAKAIDSAKWQELYNHNSEVVVLEVTLNLFEEI